MSSGVSKTVGRVYVCRWNCVGCCGIVLGCVSRLIFIMDIYMYPYKYPKRKDKNLTVASQHTRTSYLCPSARSSSTSHVDFPPSEPAVGKTTSRCVLRDHVSGVRRSTRRSDRLGCCWGVSMVGPGPRKIVFSVFAVAGGAVVRMPRRRYVRDLGVMVVGLFCWRVCSLRVGW